MDFRSGSFQNLGLRPDVGTFPMLRDRGVYVVEVPIYDHPAGQGECPALSTLQATQQPWKKERIR